MTKAGDNHPANAREQYEELSFNQILQKPLYYAVNAGDVNAFGSMIDSLAQSIARQVDDASSGQFTAGSASTAQESSLDDDTAEIGYAKQQTLHCSLYNARSPDFFEGWMADRDLVDHNQPTAQPVVLLTKSQLSDLKDVVSNIAEAANTGLLSPDDMFGQLRSVAASLGRDPDELKQDSGLKIAQMGLLGEYLDDIPYKSEVAALDEESWAAMGPEEQDNLIRSLESKLQYYQLYNDDTSRWVALSADEDPAESVYPVPLEALP